jgi:hypothetical protein
MIDEMLHRKVPSFINIIEGETNMKNYVICPICNKKFKELNTAHLISHGMTVESFDKEYPYFDRLSEEARKKKVTFKGKKHSYETKKQMSESNKGKNLGKSHTKEWKQKAREISRLMWKNNYDKLKKSRTLEGYVEKYGPDFGTIRWFTKNLSNSESSKKVKGSKIDYNRYRAEVYRITSISLRNFELENLDKRGRKKYHLDHKYSICNGFNDNISPYIIGSIYNLEIITEHENTSKQTRNSISKEKLINTFNECNFYKDLMEIENEIRDN